MWGEAATHTVREGGQFCGIRDREGECPLCKREQRLHNTRQYHSSGAVHTQQCQPAPSLRTRQLTYSNCTLISVSPPLYQVFRAGWCRIWSRQGNTFSSCRDTATPPTTTPTSAQHAKHHAADQEHVPGGLPWTVPSRPLDVIVPFPSFLRGRGPGVCRRTRTRAGG